MSLLSLSLFTATYYCMVFSSRVRVKVMVMIRFSVWLLSGYAHVSVLLAIVIVTLPCLFIYYHIVHITLIHSVHT